MTNSQGAERGGVRPRVFTLALLTIALIAAIPRLHLGATQYVEYDGYWHVWIAQQDRWANFLWDYRANAHPPLYFFLLHASFWFGRTQMVYRSVSLLSGIATVYVLGRTAAKALRSPVWAVLAALAYGLAMPAILISNEVRTYMLAAFFVQVSFFFFLDLIGELQPASIRPRVWFAVTAVLACLTEYYAFLYVTAAMLFAIVLPLARRESGLVRALLREVATFALILVLPVWEYINHFGAQGVAFVHLPDFYYNPETHETSVAFLLRNLRSELNGFLPWPVPEGMPFYAAMSALVLLGCGITWLVRKRSGAKNTAALVSLLMPLAMLCAIMAASLMRAYPFGGYLRQQFILFSFLVVCPFILIDRLTAGLPRKAVRVPAGLLAIAIVAVGVQKYEAWPKITELLLTDQMKRYDRFFPVPEAVYIDQFNLTTFLTHHHNWRWEFVESIPGTTVDAYRLTSPDNRRMILLRDKNRWNLDMREADLYDSMAKSLRASHLGSTTVFCVTQAPGPDRSKSQVEAYRNRVAELSAASGLCVQALNLANYDIYAEFRPSGNCTAQ